MAEPSGLDMPTWPARVVLAAGLWNLTLGAIIATPTFDTIIGLRSIELFWRLVLVGVLWLAGVVLILASRDLTHRASSACWASLARGAAAVLLLTTGHISLGTFATLLGVTDAIWAIVLLAIVPRGLRTPLWRLLIDQRGTANP